MYTIDFETYSEAGFEYNFKTARWVSPFKGKKGIRAVGTAVYAEHPSTKIDLLSYKRDNRSVKVWMPGMREPEELFEHIKKGGLVEAHNSMFEYWVWLNVAHRKMGWPPLHLSQMRDSMPKAAAFGYPLALGSITKAMGLEKGKLTEGKDLIKTFAVPTGERPPIGTEKHCEYVKYNMHDVMAEHEVSSACPGLSDFEMKVWKLDQVINNRGVFLDAPSIALCIHTVLRLVEAGNAELSSLTRGKITTSNQTKRMGEWIEDRGVVLPRTKKGSISLAKEVVEGLLSGGGLPSEVARMLELRKALALSSVAKLFTMQQHLCRDSRLRGAFQYLGALRTGRWAGRGPQFHNFPQGSNSVEDVEKLLIKFGTPGSVTNFNEVSSVLRGLITAGPGKELICSDYSAIEAVVLAELAGEKWRKEVFRTHGKIYEMSASKITGTPFEDFAKYKEKHGSDHPYRKTIGKVAELASGYGGWIGAWKNFGADKHFSSDKEIKEKILAWREASPAIVEFWGGQVRKSEGSWSFTPELFGVEGAVVKAILMPGRRFKIGEYINVEVLNNVLRLILPSGRVLNYRQPSLKQIPHNYSENMIYEISFKGWQSTVSSTGTPPGWNDIETYGGKLVENLTQAVARDLLANALLNLEGAGFPVVMHVHDEIICEVPKGSSNIGKFESIMARVPEWAKGWPIRVSGGWVGKRYRKG